MTQPAPPPPPEQNNTGAVVTATVIGLALIAVESRVRGEVEDDIATALTAFGIAVLAAFTTPGVIISTGVELMAQPRVHDQLTRTIAATGDKVSASIEAGYAAGAQVALAKATADLARFGYQVPPTLPELDAAVEQILRDVDTMFGHAQTDVQNSVIGAFDGVQGEDADAARQIIVPRAVHEAEARLQRRAAAAAGTAVNQGASDAQQAIYSEFQNATGERLGKRWVVTSATPCGMCRALNGTIVALGTEFDHDATTAEKDLRPVWRNLFGPPRHPNCRCQLELVRLGG